MDVNMSQYHKTFNTNAAKHGNGKEGNNIER